MPGLAAFDVDGTLTRHDTFVPFLVRVAGRAQVSSTFAVAGAATLRRRGVDRDALKEDVCRRILRGRSRAELEQLGERHAAQVLGSSLRPDVLGRLRAHQAAGHHVVLVSASLDLYLGPVAAALDVDVLCTTVAFVDDRATGELVGGNCRAAEKLRRLDAYRLEGRIDGPVWAYGDSRGDDEMLAAADHAVRVVKRTPIATEVLA